MNRKQYIDSIKNGTIELWDDVNPALCSVEIINDYLRTESETRSHLLGISFDDLEGPARAQSISIAAISEIYAHNWIGVMMDSVGLD